MAQVDELLEKLKEHGGSDLHLTSGLEPRIRISGRLTPVEGWPVLDDARLRGMMRELVTQEQWQTYDEELDLDFAYGLEGVARFRVNFFNQENGAGAVFRIIPERVASAEELGLPEAVTRLADAQEGLVLVTGPTGSGKSTTLAAILDGINERHAKHIITIEDPIEFVHPNKKSVFSQREVGTHTIGFPAALRGAIRQNPDVVLVGEMRDEETIELAVTAAEMGFLVFGTLHTNSATKTLDRLVDAFPADKQEQIRVSLSESISAIVSQLLLRTADGAGRVATHEILLRTRGLPNLIREGNTPQLVSVIQSSRGMGMQLMDDALERLVHEERVAPHDAYMKAQDKARFEKLLE